MHQDASANQNEPWHHARNIILAIFFVIFFLWSKVIMSTISIMFFIVQWGKMLSEVFECRTLSDHWKKKPFHPVSSSYITFPAVLLYSPADVFLNPSGRWFVRSCWLSGKCRALTMVGLRLPRQRRCGKQQDEAEAKPLAWPTFYQRSFQFFSSSFGLSWSSSIFPTLFLLFLIHAFICSFFYFFKYLFSQFLLLQ